MHINHQDLKKWREELDLTQEQFGLLLNLKQNTISQWEAGQRMPDLQSIVSLAKLHNKSVEQILRESHPFITIEHIDTMIDSERDIPRLLAEQAWFRYVEQFRSKAKDSDEEFGSKELQESLNKIKDSKTNPQQVINLEGLPRSIYENICKSVSLYIERCVEMMERIEQIEELPEEDKIKQAVSLHKVNRTSSFFKFDYLSYLSRPTTDDSESIEDSLDDEHVNAETSEEISAEDILDLETESEDDAEEFAAAEDDTPYNEA